MEQQEFVSPTVENDPPDDMSAFERFAAVFTSPSEAFDGLASAANKGKIILLGIVIGIIVTVFTVVLFGSNEKLRTVVKEHQIEKLDKAHKAGKIKDDMYEKQMEGMESMDQAGAFIGFGLVFGVLATVLYALLIGLIVFIVVRILQRDADATVGYGAALAATMISLMIMNLENIVTAIGMYITANPEFRISPTLFAKTDNDYLKFILNQINPFVIWMMLAFGTGIATLARTDRGKAITSFAAFWVVGGLLVTMIGSLVGKLFGG